MSGYWGAGVMTLTHIPTPAHHAPAVAEALALFERAVIEDTRTDATDNAVLERLIEHWASLGIPFSANHLRDDLPAVRKCLISRRLIDAQRRGRIVKQGYTPSTLASTKGAVVAVYIGITQQEELA